jgi:hypothetical protein
MELRGKTCAISPFYAEAADIRTADVDSVTQIFQDELARSLSEAGLLPRTPSLGADGQDITLQGQFVRISEGNRWLRYFLMFSPNAPAVVEVEGRLLDGDIPVTDFHVTGAGRMGLFGGSGPKLVRNSAKSAAHQVARQVIDALADR